MSRDLRQMAFLPPPNGPSHPRQTAYPGHYLYIINYMNSNNIIKSKYGEPDGLLLVDYNETKNKSRPYVSIDKEFAVKIINTTGGSDFIVWLACMDSFRIRKRKPFRLSLKIRDLWGISSTRLSGRLTRLQSLGWLEFKEDRGKAPLILKVNEK
jgi:hypothetical protein